MTTGTTVIWNPLVSSDDVATINARAATMESEGKTDNVPVETQPGGPGTVPLTVVRQWTTLQDAQEWLDFLTSYNPQSAVINS